jgi:hypothetical protein
MLQHRLVIPGDGSSFAPGDVDPLADTDFYITSRRRNYHPWIAQRGEGPDAGPDISVGGQRLELPLGRSVDGEVQIRVIDVPEPSCNWSVDLLGGDNIFDDAGEWTEETSLGVAGCTNPTTGLPYNVGAGDYCVAPVDATQIVAGSHMNMGLALLFNWNDDHQGNSPYGNPSPRGVWQTRTMTGLTPGEQVGITLRVNALLNGNADWEVFMRLIGLTTEEWSGHLSDVNFWNFGAGHYTPAIAGLFLGVVVPPSGEVEIQLGGQNFSPSGNINLQIDQVAFMQCVPALNSGASSDPERYVTSWLADTDARQQLLGRKAYLEESLDAGATWTRVLYAGYVKQITMDQSLTYLFTLGDAGRGRRVSRAWRDRDPVEDFVP